MRFLVALPAALLAGFALSGCVASTTPVGVLPRDPVPPPPSIARETGQRGTSQGAAGPAQRRGLSVPSQGAAPRP